MTTRQIDPLHVRGQELDTAVAKYVMGMEFRPYSQDIEASWIVHKTCCAWPYSKRHRYLAALRTCISWRVLRKSFAEQVALEEVAHLMEPVDMCRAALMVSLEDKG